jgi:NADPH:quinone reductase-like Zn-dependent oxidoreductase
LSSAKSPTIRIFEESSMKVIRIHAYGGAENLKYDEVPCPEPKTDEVLSQVYAAGVNLIEGKICEGWLKQAFDYPLPVIVRTDISGVVDRVSK